MRASAWARVAGPTLAAVMVVGLLPACGSTAPAPASPAPATAPASPSASPPARFDARLSLYDYPFPVAMFPVQTQGLALEMAYMDVAPTADANGQTVLLLHGKNFSGAYWARTATALAALGYRVVIPDQIGFGKSSKPVDYQFSFHALAKNTAALLDQLGVGETLVVGHSMGGMLATRFALMFRDRTRRLVLVNPIGLEDWKRVVPYPGIDGWYRSELAKTPDGVVKYMSASYFDGAWKPEYDELAAIQQGWTQSADREQLAWVSARTYDMVFTQPVVHEFGDLRVPTLLIIGTRDRTAVGKNLASPEVAATLGRYDQLGRATAAAIPQAELVEIDGVGHIPQVESWDAYIAALRGFLAAN